MHHPIWVSVSTNTLSISNGTFYFSDSHFTNYHNRFYRIIAP
ncbi:MAG TPA: hypothetical protein VL970_07010 [Candidatus Acidoferrales bacterium]|nr:hypothetical protein [Candidatus Acidoferrales bacterium]